MSGTQDDVQTGEKGGSSLSTVWIVTHLGARYEMPDMLPTHVDSMIRQLHDEMERITILNVSEAVMILPRRIIKQAGVWERCFWEAK